MTLLAADPDFLTGLQAMDPARRRAIIARLEQPVRHKLIAMLDERARNPYFEWRHDPVGFVQDRRALGETMWSQQRTIVESVRDHKRTAVPACHAPGKSHIAARVIGWWGSVHPEGTVRILTTATTFRQVKNVLWPYLRRVHSMHGLPGQMNLTEWRIGKGNDIMAEGIKPADEDESALSGLHAPHVLIVVDEAGGISHAYGQQLLGLLTGNHTRLLLIGNPPADDEGSWFEKQCSMTDLYNVIPIAASDTPNWTGEDAGICAAHPEAEPHSVAEHLVDKEWADDLVREYGEGSPVVLARRDAIFPKSNQSKVMPILWLQAALHERDVKTKLNLPDDRVREGVIKLGVDIAEGGPDAFTIYALDGNTVRQRHRSVGEVNARPGYVEDTIVEEVLAAIQLHRDRDILEPVRVKVDTVGPGWGIYQGLKKREAALFEGRAVLVPVEAGNKAIDPHFVNVRSEMWWVAGRKMVEPDKRGEQSIVLDVPDAVIQQLNAPKWGEDATGHIWVEKKIDMKKRGIKSPDDADAILMAMYEPVGFRASSTAAPIDASNPMQQVQMAAPAGASAPFFG